MGVGVKIREHLPTYKHRAIKNTSEKRMRRKLKKKKSYLIHSIDTIRECKVCYR